MQKKRFKKAAVLKTLEFLVNLLKNRFIFA